ncbi:hypothetical protein JW948_14930 [bacterium]|nr:hypothetical protein [bacterium]
MTDRLLEWIGRSRYQADMNRIRAFWRGEGRYLVSVNTTAHAYRQVFDDARILALAPRNLETQSRLPGTSMPAFFADFGTVSTAKYWGGRVRFDSTGANIFIEPAAQNVEEALSITPLPIDHRTMDEPESLAGETVLIPYISLDKQTRFHSVTEYYEHLLASTGNRTRFWFAFPEDTQEAIAFAEKYQ